MSIIKLDCAFFAQENYNNCNQALMICPNKSYNLNNIGANNTLCPNCEDDLAFCFTSFSSIWLTFKTNDIGGDVNIDLSNLIFEMNPSQDLELNAVVFTATVPCDAASYSAVSPCYTNQTGNFTMTASMLNPLTVYYILISGDKAGVGVTTAAEATFDLQITGPGITRIPPTIALGVNNINICKGEVSTFYTSLGNCTDTSQFMWYVNNNLAAVTDSSFWATSDIENGDTVKVIVSCFLDCKDTLTEQIGPLNVYTFPVDAGPDQSLALGATTFLAGNTTADTFIWSPGIFLSDINILNPFCAPDNNVTYTLSATQNGCTQYDEVQISLNDFLIIPTTFTPNNDGNNDSWVIVGIENFPNNILKIYDRWGQIVFQTTGYTLQKAWNGLEGSKAIPEGVYFYSLDLRSSGKNPLKGSITLIR